MNLDCGALVEWSWLTMPGCEVLVTGGAMAMSVELVLKTGGWMPGPARTIVPCKTVQQSDRAEGKILTILFPESPLATGRERLLSLTARVGCQCPEVDIVQGLLSTVPVHT